MPDLFQLRSLFPPINSIIAEIVPNDGSSKPELFYPLFSSHLMLPVKVGETVWVIYETPPSSGTETPGGMSGLSEKRVTSTTGGRQSTAEVASNMATSPEAIIKRAVVTRIFTTHDQTIKPGGMLGTGGGGDNPHTLGGYWISRVPGSRVSEDLNFTHIDRDLDTRIIKVDGASVSEIYPDGYTPQFLNGPPPSEEPVEPTYGSTNSYEALISQANVPGVTVEPVPPFSKRAGDMVLQGSNNTLIWLGEDRIGGTSMTDENYSKGTIDLVVGRGLSVDSGDVDNTISARAAARGLDGSRMWPERDKAPELSEEEINFSEGDIDLRDDRSRIYISAACKVDRLFCSPDTTGASVNLTFTDTAASVTARKIMPIGTEDEEMDAPYSLIDPDEFLVASAVVKSDHIRLVGRESVRIMVESDKGPNTAPEIILHKDGNIFINPGVDGHVLIGGGPDDQPSSVSIPMQGFCHVKSFPDGEEGGMGSVGEMEMTAKSPGMGRYSERVKMLLVKGT